MVTQVGQTERELLLDQLRDALHELRVWIESGRLGFDYAIKEYADLHNNELAHAFLQYVWIMRLDNPDTRDAIDEDVPLMDDMRRHALYAVAERVNLPEMNRFVEAMLSAQGHRGREVSALRALSQQMNKS